MQKPAPPPRERLQKGKKLHKKVHFLRRTVSLDIACQKLKRAEKQRTKRETSNFRRWLRKETLTEERDN